MPRLKNSENPLESNLHTQKVKLFILRLLYAKYIHFALYNSATKAQYPCYTYFIVEPDWFFCDRTHVGMRPREKEAFLQNELFFIENNSTRQQWRQKKRPTYCKNRADKETIFP